MNGLFDSPPDRKATKSFKWNREDIIPLWVADMDFPCAKPISDALIERAKHPIYGYTTRDEGYINAFLDWMKRRHQFSPAPEWLTFSPPGIIYAIERIVQIATKPGDSIIVPTPDYTSFYDVVKGTGRKLIYTPMLQNVHGKYELDIEGIKRQAADGAKMLIFSSPNNPTGRVYRGEELLKLVRISGEYGLLILSDEIFADFVYKGNKHLPIHTIDQGANDKIISFYAVNKSFNLGGLQMSTVIIPDEELRNQYNAAMYIAQTRLDNVFGVIAFENAYNYGEQWLDQVIAYVAENRAFVENKLIGSLPEIKICPGEGTFLIWLDCRALNLGPERLKDLFIEKAGIIPTFGDEFGPLGEGFVRLNIACAKPLLEQAISQLVEAKRKL